MLVRGIAFARGGMRVARCLSASAAAAGGAEMSEGERAIVARLRERFPHAKTVNVEDISGGCGSMYRVSIEDGVFRGKTKVQQHKMVTETLRGQIKTMHGITIETRTPKEPG